jgi:hypothetical protein
MLGLLVFQGSRFPKLTEWQIITQQGKCIPMLWQDSEGSPIGGLVVSTGFSCSVGREASGTSRLAKCGAWGSFACVAAGSLYWVASWGCLGGSKICGLDSSDVHKAAEVLGSTCADVWASRSHSRCCSHGKTKFEDNRSSGVCLPGAGFQEQQELLQTQGNQDYNAAEVLGLPFWCRLLGMQYLGAAGMRKPSLLAYLLLLMEQW